MKPIFSSLLAIISITSVQLAVADQTAATQATAPVVGDATAGQQKITTCAACHGADGNSPIAANPNLAGQHPEYIIRALTEYQSGVRNNPIMAGMAAGLSAQDIADIAAYYSSQTEKVGEADPNLVKQGELLYRAGDAARGIPACMACHGPVGDGNGPAHFPRVANQNPDYVMVALKEYQAGTRPSPNDMMNDIAQKLNDKDMQAVASYMYGLYPAGMKLPEPTPATATNAPAGNAAAPTSAAGTTTATAESATSSAAATAPAATAASGNTTEPAAPTSNNAGTTNSTTK